MRNWSIDTSQFDTSSPEYEKWRLEQLINFGLQGEKIDERHLSKHLKSLVIDLKKKAFLELLLKDAQAN